MAAGAVPVLPDRLSYPEVVPVAWHGSSLYPDGGLTARLRDVLGDLEGWRSRVEGLAGAMRQFDWSVVVDDYEAAWEEAGDLLLPLAAGVIDRDHVVAEMSELVGGSCEGRTSEQEITLFKSVGLAVEDALAANAPHIRLLQALNMRFI